MDKIKILSIRLSESETKYHGFDIKKLALLMQKVNLITKQKEADSREKRSSRELKILKCFWSGIRTNLIKKEAVSSFDTASFNFRNLNTIHL